MSGGAHLYKGQLIYYSPILFYANQAWIFKLRVVLSNNPNQNSKSPTIVNNHGPCSSVGPLKPSLHPSLISDHRSSAPRWNQSGMFSLLSSLYFSLIASPVQCSVFSIIKTESILYWCRIRFKTNCCIILLMIDE